MQKHPTIIMLIIVASLALVIGVYFVIKKQNQATIEFNLSTDKKADRISIESRQSNCTLKLVSKTWLANNAIVVRPGLAEFVLSKLKLLKIDYPVSMTLIDELNKTINEEGTVVNIYNKDELTYTLKFIEYQGKNIVQNKKGDLFYVSVAGNQRMSLEKLLPSNADAWASQSILKLNAPDIDILDMSYPLAPEHNFKIFKDIDQHKLENIELDQLNPTNINDYLLFYTGITYTNYPEDIYEMAQDPLFILKLKIHGTSVKEYTGYQLFYHKDKRSEKFKCALIADSKDTVLVSYDELDPILAQKEYFLKK